jgi:hypothetical protein
MQKLNEHLKKEINPHIYSKLNEKIKNFYEK